MMNVISGYLAIGFLVMAFCFIPAMILFGNAPALPPLPRIIFAFTSPPLFVAVLVCLLAVFMGYRPSAFEMVDNGRRGLSGGSLAVLGCFILAPLSAWVVYLWYRLLKMLTVPKAPDPV